MRSASTTIEASWCTVRAASDVDDGVADHDRHAHPLPLGVCRITTVAFRQREAAMPRRVIRDPRRVHQGRRPVRDAAIDASPMRTVIHGGDVIAYHDGGHRLLRGGSAGLRRRPRRVRRPARTPGPSDRRIDATGKLVMPGLVNLHCHATTEASGRLIADAGRRDFFHTGFLNYQTRATGRGAAWTRARTSTSATASRWWSCCGTAARRSSSSARSTTRTVAFAGQHRHPRVPDAGLPVGRPTASGPRASSATTGTRRPAARPRAGEGASSARIRGRTTGAIRGMLYPLQVDTCSPELFRATRKAADELGVGI